MSYIITYILVGMITSTWAVYKGLKAKESQEMVFVSCCLLLVFWPLLIPVIFAINLGKYIYKQLNKGKSNE